MDKTLNHVTRLVKGHLCFLCAMDECFFPNKAQVFNQNETF